MTEVTRGFCWHQNFVPWGCLPRTCGYIYLLNHEKICIKSEVEEILFKLATYDHSDEAFLLTSKFWLQWVVCHCPRAMYKYRIMKQICIKSECRAIFWNVQLVMKVIRPFCLHTKHCPQGLSPLALGLYIHVWNKTKYQQKIIRQKGSFWNWYKMMGKIKALKCCQNLYQVLVCPCPGAFMTLGRSWPFLWQGQICSWCFCIGDSL